MTTKDKIARRKLSMLQLAQELNNVSKACAIMGYSRQQFYEIRRNFQTYGAEGLIDRLPGPRGPHPNRVSAEIETAVWDKNDEDPAAVGRPDELLCFRTKVRGRGPRADVFLANQSGGLAYRLSGKHRELCVPAWEPEAG